MYRIFADHMGERNDENSILKNFFLRENCAKFDNEARLHP
jgi:hypothetical protein